MSADSYAICPKCYPIPAIPPQDPEALYGKVPIEVYEDAARAYRRWKGGHRQTPKETLQENYDIGICEGEFVVSYSAKCSNCKFQWKFDHTHSFSKKV